MHIAILTLTFSLPSCGSLKEKRQRMGGLHARFGNTPSIAVCESGERNRLQSRSGDFSMRKREAANGHSIALVTLMSTHPKSGQRIAKIQGLLPEVPPIYQATAKASSGK